MSTIRSFEQRGLAVLSPLYEPSEAHEILRQLLEEALGCTRTQLLLADKDTTLLASDKLIRLDRELAQLAEGTPLQYVLQRAYFFGYELYVAPGVLIPRPETEELVELILGDVDSAGVLRLLDVGTGSGCIAYALGASLPNLEQLIALEVSSQAIPIAARNFETLERETGRSVYLWKKDLFELVEDHTPPTQPFDLLVSNPPYIHPEESEAMTPQVLLHEPHLALFAPETAPTLYYRALAELVGQGYLRSGGKLWVELNPLYAELTRSEMLSIIGVGRASAELIRDLSGRERFLKLTYLGDSPNESPNKCDGKEV